MRLRKREEEKRKNKKYFLYIYMGASMAMESTDIFLLIDVFLPRSPPPTLLEEKEVDLAQAACWKGRTQAWEWVDRAGCVLK